MTRKRTPSKVAIRRDAVRERMTALAAWVRSRETSRNDDYGEGYDLVLLAQVEATRIDADELQRRLERDDHAAVAQSLKDVGFGSALNLLTSYAGQASDLRPWLERGEINRDRNLRLQYLAGLSLHADQGKKIYEEMLLYRSFPENLFIGSGLRARALRGLLARAPREP